MKTINALLVFLTLIGISCEKNRIEEDSKTIIKGKLINEFTGEPIPNGAIMLTYNTSNHPRDLYLRPIDTVKTNNLGEYEFRLDPIQDSVYVILPDDRGYNYKSNTFHHSFEVDITQEETIHDFQVCLAGWINLQLINETNAHIVNFWTRVEGCGNESASAGANPGREIKNVRDTSFLLKSTAPGLVEIEIYKKENDEILIIDSVFINQLEEVNFTIKY